ncbi:hypothetical protein G6L37_05870 [Agrobacterium rubi]|nr:hypothetical protein [Agrobacterium rubi]NTF24887.1 hypothetical protein [Agrobacterium rubi]
MTSTDDLTPYDVGPVIETIVEPMESWADSGYAEGVISFLPALGREPLLISPGSASAVFGAIGHDISAEEPTAADKAEFARRLDFVEELLVGIMTRESEIRDRYYESRNRGMLHRTAFAMLGLGAFTAAAVTLPSVAGVLVCTLLTTAALVSYRRFSIKAESLRSIHLFEDRAPRIIAELPWMVGREHISPREPLEEVC